MNCVNCGAPLPPNSGVCRHCTSLNDIDLRGIFDASRGAPDETRICPRCDEHLEALNVGVGGAFVIERCRSCLGLFFDSDELDHVVREKIGAASRVDRTRLARILAEELPPRNAEVRYIKCPSCRALMNRRTYGARSGVVVDECRDHGIWLDGGELRQILKWTKVGGAKIEEQRKKDEARAAASREKFAKATGSGGGMVSPEVESEARLSANVIEITLSIITEVFRRF